MQTVFNKNGTQIQLPEKQDTFTNTNNKFKSFRIGDEKEFVIGIGSFIQMSGSNTKQVLKDLYFNLLENNGPGTYLFTYQIEGSIESCIMTCVSNTYGGFMIFGYLAMEQVLLNNGNWNK